MAAAPPEKSDATPTKVPVNKETLWQAARLFRYLLPYRGKFIVAMVALLISSALGLAFPYLIGSLIDVALRNGNILAAPAHSAGAPGIMPGSVLGEHSLPRLTLNQVFFFLICQLTLQAVFTYFQVIWFNEVGERALVNIRCDTYSRLIALPMAFFSQRRVGELSSRISADLTQIEDTLTVPRHSSCARRRCSWAAWHSSSSRREN